MIQQIVQKVQDSEVFKKWHSNEYLVGVFIMDQIQQVNFYSKETKKITSFMISDKIEKQEDLIFQKEPKDLEKLNLENLKINLDEAFKKTNKIKEEKALSEEILKKIIILQQQSSPTWNITYITSAFNLLNVKINATNGIIIESKFQSIISLKKD